MRVLLVEDDAGVAQSIELMLRVEGFYEMCIRDRHDCIGVGVGPCAAGGVGYSAGPG